MAAAVPLAVAGVQAYMSHRANKKSKEEQAAAGGANANAAALGQQSQSLFKFGNPLLQQSSNYYQRILNGGRGAMEQALQPERAMITDTYRGAESSLERSGVRGPARDLAMSQMSRDRAGQIASLVPNARMGAASAVGNLGQFGASGGQQAASLSGGMYNQLLQGGRDDRRYANEQSAQTGQQIGSAVAESMKMYKSKNNGPATTGGTWGGT